MHNNLWIRGRLSVVRHHEDVDSSYGVIRAHKLKLGILRQVSEVKEREVSITTMDANRLCILAIVLRLLDKTAAIGISLATTCNGPIQDFLRGSQNGNVHAT